MHTKSIAHGLPLMLDRISDYASYYAAVVPHAEAAVHESIRLSYGELSEQVDAVAKALLVAGVRGGDRIAMLSTPHPSFLVVFLASVSVGAIWVGLDPRYRIDELQRILRDIAPVVLFSRLHVSGRDYVRDLSALAAEFPGLRIVRLDGQSTTEWLSLDQFTLLGQRACPRDLSLARSRVSANDPAVIIYTSGTTGTPKGALLTHRGLVRCSRVQAGIIDPHPLRMLNNLPISHIGCVGDISCYTLVAGGTIVFMEKFDPVGVLRVIEREKVTVWGQLPTMFQLCVSVPNFADFDLSSIQVIFWSGGAASKPLVRRLAGIAPTLGCSYGTTETVGSVTFAVGNKDVDVLADSVGWPSAEYEFRIVDDEGREVRRPGEVGEIQVRGDFIMKGYWNQPEATAHTIEPSGWLHSGDLACFRPDGAVQLVGRLTEMFKSGGYNVYPQEVEQVIAAFPGATMSAVIGVPDSLYGEVGHAYVLVARGSVLDEGKLREHCRNHLANYKVPKKFVMTSDLPTLPNGKVDKRALRNRARENEPELRAE